VEKDFRNQLRWAKSFTVTGVAIFGMALGAAFAPAQAQAKPPGPNSCVSGGGGFIGGGSFTDCDLWPDGSFWHTWRAWGPFASGGGAMRVCDNGTPAPAPTDNDPNTPCP
jgi:hypothetical protein